MAVTFSGARRIVDVAAGPTLPKGYEDATTYSVLLVDPAIDDTVLLVSKESGTLRRVPYWDVEDVLDAMTPVTDPE